MKPLLNQLGTFGIVTVVTLLVWLYAEDANIQEYTGQTVRVQFVLPEGSDGIIGPAEPITIEVDFNGSNGQYQQFIQQTRGVVIPITPTFDLSKDQHAVDVELREQLEQYEGLSELGINLTRVSPERERVTFEKYVELTLDVRIVQETGGIRLSSATIEKEEQRRVTLRKIPASEAAQFAGVNAVARVREQDVADIAKGDSKEFDVEIEFPARLREWAPPGRDVQVLVTVANDRDTVTIDRRPILLSYPSSINERYIVEVEEAARFITSFKLEGPREQIAQLKQDPASAVVWASVRLTNEEADAAATNGGELTKAVEIIAPPGVTLASDVVRVTIRVTPRGAAPNP